MQLKYPPVPSEVPFLQSVRVICNPSKALIRMKRTRKKTLKREITNCVKHTISLTFIFNSINIKNHQRQLSIQIYSVGKKEHWTDHQNPRCGPNSVTDLTNESGPDTLPHRFTFLVYKNTDVGLNYLYNILNPITCPKQQCKNSIFLKIFFLLLTLGTGRQAPSSP